MNMERRTSFDRIAGRYDFTRVLPEQQQQMIARGIMAAVGGTMGTRFVEPGVGTGRIAIPLLREGARYVGTDISPGMLGAFRSKLRAEPWLLGQVELFEGDAETLPLPPASVDVALTAHLLHLVPDWRRALDEIRRVVRPGGYYVQCSDDAGAIHVAFRNEWNRLSEQRGVQAKPPVAPGPSQILAHFGLPATAMTSKTLARWPSPTKVSDALQRYGEREVSHLWAMAETDYTLLMAELEAWSIASYGSLDVIGDAEAAFHITVICLN